MTTRQPIVVTETREREAVEAIAKREYLGHGGGLIDDFAGEIAKAGLDAAFEGRAAQVSGGFIARAQELSDQVPGWLIERVVGAFIVRGEIARLDLLRGLDALQAPGGRNETDLLSITKLIGDQMGQTHGADWRDGYTAAEMYEARLALLEKALL